MYVKMFTAFVIAGAGVVAFGQAVPMDGAQPAPAAGVDLSAAPVSVMTGTIAERNAAIEKALAGDGRVSQMNMTEMELGTLLHFMSMQMKVDLRMDTEGLALKGVVPGLVTFVFYNVSFPQVLEAIRWVQRPKEGSVVWKVEDGVLRLVAVAEAAGPAKETAAEVRQDTAMAEALKKPMPMETEQKLPLAELTGLMATTSKVNLVVDWKTLEEAGVTKETVVKVPVSLREGEDLLKAVLSGLKVKEGEVGYEIWGGLVRVSTKARLAAEKPAAADGAATRGGLP